MSNYYKISFNFYVDDTQSQFKLGSKYEYVSKLNTVLNAVQTWMLKRKLKLNKDNTNTLVVCNPL